ncbi:MAG: acyl carrier protein [Ferrovibrio sp.]|nr:acyl carrier protein [Ferrovibrio sp.]
MTTRETVTHWLADHLNKPTDTIQDSTRIIDDLGADSLDIVEIAMWAEDEFDIGIEDREAEAALTVGDLVSLIDGKLAAKPLKIANGGTA